MRRYPCPHCGRVRPLFRCAERPDGSRYEARAGKVRLCWDCYCDWLDAEVIAAPVTHTQQGGVTP